MVTVFIMPACNIQKSTLPSSSEVMNNYYSLNDFDWIKIGKSTYKDLSDIFGTTLVCYTSYGGICEFPMENGNYIQIKFYGSEMIIKEIKTSHESVFSY